MFRCNCLPSRHRSRSCTLKNHNQAWSTLPWCGSSWRGRRCHSTLAYLSSSPVLIWVQLTVKNPPPFLTKNNMWTSAEPTTRAWLLQEDSRIKGAKSSMTPHRSHPASTSIFWHSSLWTHVGKPYREPPSIGMIAKLPYTRVALSRSWW